MQNGNKYDRKSKKVFKKKCKACGEKHEILESYAHYFLEYRKMNPFTALVCPDCGLGEITL